MFTPSCRHIHYDVSTREEFFFLLKKWAQKRYRSHPLLYLGFHGRPGALLLGSGKRAPQVTLEEIGEALAGKCNGRVILFGSCETIRAVPWQRRKFLDATQALAICGYRWEVDWMTSAAMDLIVLAAMQPLTGLLCTTSVASAPCNASGPFAFFRRTAPRPIPGYQRITRAEDTGESNYNGVFFQVSRRMARDFTLQSSYTFSKVIDNAPEGTAVLPGNFGDDSKIVWDPLNIALDRGLGDADIRHRWVFSGVWDIGYANRARNTAVRLLLGQWQLSSIIQAQSGRVFSPRIGQDLNNDGNIANERVPFAARNSLRLPAFVTADLRLAKDIPLWRESRASLKLLGEAFNLTNRANITGKNAVRYNVNLTNFEFRPNAAYLFDTTAGDPRILQLALRLTF
mgnify:CR=1 FL=1